jgi:ABC-type multidrug transport system ATPase subunit
MITQLMEEAALCHRVAVLKQGSLVQLDTPRAVFRNAAVLATQGSTYLPWCGCGQAFRKRRSAEWRTVFHRKAGGCGRGAMHDDAAAQ